MTGRAAVDGKDAPARADHTRIGSITKTFTVMLLLLQADEGLVSLDDPIGKYVKGCPTATPPRCACWRP